MEVSVIWTKQADEGLSKTLDYLEKEWTIKEILRLEHKIKKFIERICSHPNIYPNSKKHPSLYKGMVDENNYIVYRVNKQKRLIIIINFKDAKQASID